MTNSTQINEPQIPEDILPRERLLELMKDSTIEIRVRVRIVDDADTADWLDAEVPISREAANKLLTRYPNVEFWLAEFRDDGVLIIG